MAGGHAGFTYGFDLEGSLGNVVCSAVLKTGPPGVARRGAADIFRQAALLRELANQGVPVPALLWAEAGDELLGVPYIVMKTVPGRERFPLLAEKEPGVTPAEVRIWSEGLHALAALDRFAVLPALAGWQQPVQLADEFAAWEATLRKATDPMWIDLGLRARDALAVTLPRGSKVALVHGDFQPSNLMSLNGELTAIIDWDLAHIGTSGLDAGWMMMWSDPAYWGPHWKTWAPFDPVEIAHRFTHLTGGDEGELRWFHAYAGYRFGAIACLNVRLHRSGRRPDAVWEKFALDVPRLFKRSRHLAAALPSV